MQDVQLDIAVKKPNWDLKRDIAKKLDKLERRTQAAIMEVIKEKVAEVCSHAAVEFQEENRMRTALLEVDREKVAGLCRDSAMQQRKDHMYDPGCAHRGMLSCYSGASEDAGSHLK